MTGTPAELTTLELVALIAGAAEELRRRGSGTATPPPSAEVQVEESPVSRRRCHHCRAPILIAATEKNGHWIPLDEADGNYILANGKARWVDGGGTHAFHYDTCPGAAQNQSVDKKSRFDDLTEELGLTTAALTDAGADA